MEVESRVTVTVLGLPTLVLSRFSVTPSIASLIVFVALLIATPYVTALQKVVIPWAYLGIMALFFLPTFMLLTAVMVAVGSAVTNHHQGQQVAGMLNLLFMAPIFLVFLIFQNPGGPVVVFMSLFPPTAFLTISLRWGVGSVPPWQIGVSLALLLATTLFMVWTAVRVFQFGMLRYGQPLSIRQAVMAFNHKA